MSLVLANIPLGSTNYPAIVKGNFDAIEAAVNSLAAQISAAVGDGALLTLDEFDRDGIVGAASYQLDIENYAGGSQITIGRRPAFNIAFGEQDISVAWATFAGVKHRVTQTGDVTLDASAIVAGLPKTIYIGVPSGGTAQLFEDNSAPNILYLYSMTWDGFGLSDFARLAQILPGYSTHQALASNVRTISIQDTESEFLDDPDGRVDLVLPGAPDDNVVGIDGAVEVVGFAITAHRGDDEGLYAPTGVAPDNQLTLEIQSETVRWNKEDIVFDASNIPDTIFAAVDKDVVGLDRFVTEFRRFTIVRTQIGSEVISARNFTLTLFVRPLIGAAVPKDKDSVDML